MTSLAKVSIGVKAFIDEHKANGNSAPKVLEKWMEPYLSQCIERLLVRGPDIRCTTHELTQRGPSGLLPVQLSLTQKIFATAALLIWQRIGFHRSSRSGMTILAASKSTFCCELS